MKKEREYFYEMGRRDFENGVPCQPYKSRGLMEHATAEGRADAESMTQFTKKMKWWCEGWMRANLDSPWE